ncbi:MAG: multicopper oxidase domain-containing protein [Candidatus Eremiobacteraeota bacterium]|nr:multicopper oxidase domain-containing protein [Candidatus Eremiobacteraeota bacterium]MBV8498417.1 multicopper oxidase domain-containing protein [Candidatus Eremiobacteraeota bacterium]
MDRVLDRGWRALLAFALLVGAPAVALADADQAATASSTSLGLQPLRGAIPLATPAPGESSVFQRPDGAYQAIPAKQGRVKTFHIVERAAPWTLKPGLTVMANTYNGVVPGPALVVRQGETLVLDYTNDGTTPDSIHLHGVHDIPVTMDGVGGISQALVPPGGHFVYRFVADQPGTFIYHTHDDEAMLDSGLYGAIVVEPSTPRAVERAVAHDFLEMISSWQIQSAAENHFTLNGKEYPSTRELNVRAGERFRIRWINISGEEFHTMHTHGHYQQVVARDAAPVNYADVQDTVLVAPGQRVDVVVDANAKPGTWLIHCHVMDHIEDSSGMPAGLITAIHYVGTPNTLTAMYRAMMPAAGPTTRGLSFAMTVLLGAIAGFTIFLGLPVARARRLSPQTIALLNALAIGILLYLVVEIAQNAIAPISQGLNAWHASSGAFPAGLIVVFVAGLLIGLVGLGSAATHFTRQAAMHAENPIVLAAIIAIGIGAHNFGEGLAIGASAAAGATAVALALIVGFGLHNATEGFGVAAPLVGRVVPSWAQIGLAGLIAGGPTFVGTIIGYSFYSPTLSVLFLAIAVGALVFVIGELWSVLRRTGLTASVTVTMCAGFLIALATELFLDMNGG